MTLTCVGGEQLGDTALTIASRNGREKSMRELLEGGADAHAMTNVSRAARARGTVARVRLTRPARHVGVAGDGGGGQECCCNGIKWPARTPRDWAEAGGHRDAVKVIVRCGAPRRRVDAGALARALSTVGAGRLLCLGRGRGHAGGGAGR